MEHNNRTKEEMEEARGLLLQGLGRIIKATFKVSKEVARGFKEGYREEPEEEKWKFQVPNHK